MTGFLRRTIVRAAAACLLAAIGGGLPTALITFIGWPLPTRIPPVGQLGAWLTSPISDQVILNTLTVAAWLLWAAFIHALTAEARAALRGMPTAATSAATANPLRMAAASLVTAITLGTVLGGTAVASPSPAHASPPTGRPAHAAAQTALPAPARIITVRAGTRSYSYVVERHDTLSKIAADWLGDASRWPEICRLNYHRHFPEVGGTLRDCDLIHPGWNLFLPTDAQPPAAASPAPPAPHHDPAPAPPHEPSSPAPLPGSASPGPPSGVVTPAPSAPAATPAPSTPGSATAGTPTPGDSAPASTGPPSHAATAVPSTRDAAPAAPAAADDGVTLPGVGYLPWALATAITAAAAMVWLQRRRRHIYGEPDTTEITDLPEPVTEVHKHVSRHVGVPRDLAERAGAVPAMTQLPTGGVGLTGDGAHCAARAALAAALASGGPRDPDRRGEVVIDGSTLTTLLGADAAALGPWPRLHVADDFDHALTILDSRLLHRARVLDEHSLDDLDTLRQRAPSEEALPPVLLIAETPPPGARMRARVSFGLGNGLDVTALLLGPWPYGSTVAVDADGNTRVEDGPPDAGIGGRIAVLEAGAAVAVLATLREAHTGEPTTIALPARTVRPADPAPAQASDGGERTPDDPGCDASEETGLSDDADPADDADALDTDHPAGDVPPVTIAGLPARAYLRVLGNPHVEGVVLPGRALRGKAAELGVYLACHPDGADTHTIGEHLAPEYRVRQADQQVHTNASNLRHVLGRAAGPRSGAYVVKHGSAARYRLDPATVEVDLWQVRDLLQRAQLASPPARTQLLREACELCTAPLADGCDYEWIEPHRQQAIRWATDVHQALAEDLLADDPHAACDVLDKAITLDRYNEELYRKAMHARHAIGDADGIRALLRAVTKALTDLDVPPQDSTVELASRLRATLGGER